MQIIIGGDYRIEFGKGAGTKTKFAKFEGELGLMFKTEVIKNLEPRNPQRFTTDIETEYRASYFDIKRQYIYFEVWNWNGWQLNNFFDLKSLEIEEVVQSEDLHFEMIFQREMKGGKKFNTMRVRLKLAFE